MASKKSSLQERTEATASLRQPEGKVAASDKPMTTNAPKPALAPPAPTGPEVPFARWFQAKRFKSHWRGGMEAFADTSGRKTMEEWDQVFKNY